MRVIHEYYGAELEIIQTGEKREVTVDRLIQPTESGYRMICKRWAARDPFKMIPESDDGNFRVREIIGDTSEVYEAYFVAPDEVVSV